MRGYRDRQWYLRRLSIVASFKCTRKGALTHEQRRMETSSCPHTFLIAVKLHGRLVKVFVYRGKNRLSRVECRVEEHPVRLDFEGAMASIRRITLPMLDWSYFRVFR